MGKLSRRSLLGGIASASGLSLVGKSSAQQATPIASPAPAALKDLESRLRGTLIRPGDSAYLSASSPANARYDEIRPLAVARCADDEDVATCVAWCNETGIPPVPRGGGHSYAGFCTTEGLLIDLRRLNHYAVDFESGTASVGGGALNGDAMTALENGPAFIPGGTCLGVGYGGLTLGGGIGYNAHWAGLTCDHLTAATMVTAVGDIIQMDETQHPDLFWASRGGGGGTFGIHTSFEFNLLDSPRKDVSWYRFDWNGADDVEAAFAAFDKLIQTAPNELNAVAMMEPTPAPDDNHHAAIHAMSRGQYIGPVDELRDLVQPLLDAATPTKQDLTAMPYWSIQRMIASTEQEPHSWGDISRYSAESLPAAIVHDLVMAVVESPFREEHVNGSIWSLGWVGGVVSEVPRTETAYVHRTATTLLRPTTVWDATTPYAAAELNAWAASVIDLLTPYTLAESYQNFPNRLIENWDQLYFAENYSRLVDVKTQYDPHNLIANPQSVRPSDRTS